jgi:hypothetical protein
MAVLLKKLNAAAFKEEEMPTRFLSNKFISTDRDKFAGELVEIDAVRGLEEYAIDVTPYSGGRSNKATKFTRKEYSPPAYDEYTFLTARELNKVQPGKTEYELASDLADMLLEKQLLLRNKILRAIELLSRDALVSGQITLINGDIIDFHQKASHQYSTPVAWTNATANPLNDFSAVGQIVRKNGVKTVADSVFGDTALQKFLNNDIVKSKGDLQQIERMAITSPMSREEGAEYHGTFSAGSYPINIWTYPQFVGVPLGFSLPNEGTKVPYIPDDKIVVLPTMPDFRLFYAGIPSLTDNVSAEIRGITGLPEFPIMEAVDLLPYFLLDYEHQSIKVGVKSRPLPVPVGIDQFAIITVT